VTKEAKEILDRIKATLPSPVESTPEEQARLARDAELKTWLDAAPKIGVPRRLWGASFATELRSAAIAWAQQYVEGGEAQAGGCLVLTGPTGVGKSYAAVAALRAWEDVSRQFLHFPALCGALLDHQRRAGALEAVKHKRFIVLDDFGAEYPKEGGLLETLVDEIICHREAEILSTVVTTNITPEELKHRLSDRIVDRFRGDWGRIFAVTGANLRSTVAELPASGVSSEAK